MPKMKLTFRLLELANQERAKESSMPITFFDPGFFAMELAGEAGELCNVVKKSRRIEILGANHPMNRKAITQPLKEMQKLELGDVVIVADLLAQRLGLSLQDCVQAAFDQKSTDIGSAVRIGLTSKPETVDCPFCGRVTLTAYPACQHCCRTLPQ